MDVEALLQKMRSELDALKSKRAIKATELNQIDAEIRDLSGQVEGITAAAARYGVIKPVQGPSSVDMWHRLNRQQAAERVLRESGGEAHLRDIIKRLAEVGRDDNADLLSAALSALQRKGVVTKKGGGIWALVVMDRPSLGPGLPNLMMEATGT